MVAGDAACGEQPVQPLGVDLCAGREVLGSALAPVHLDEDDVGGRLFVAARVKLFATDGGCVDRRARLGIADLARGGDQLVAEGFVVRRVDDSARFATGEVDAKSLVVDVERPRP